MGQDIMFYDNFAVASATDKYRLTVSGFQGGTTFDAMAFHNGRLFTTYDRDNDLYPTNCALLRGPSAPAGGWWHRNCWRINPNKFYTHRQPGAHVKFGDAVYYAPFFEMKIRPWNCYADYF